MNAESDRELHDREIKIRLTETDEKLLKAIARKLGIPPGVLGRSFIKKHLEADITHSSTAA